MGKYERLHIFYNHQKQLMYSVSSTPPRPIALIDQDDLEIIRRLKEHEPVLNPRLEISWLDEDGDTFNQSATNTLRFRQILDDIPDVLQKLKR